MTSLYFFANGLIDPAVKECSPPKIKGSFLLDKNKIKNNILPSFTRKIFKTVSEY